MHLGNHDLIANRRIRFDQFPSRINTLTLKNPERTGVIFERPAEKKCALAFQFVHVGGVGNDRLLANALALDPRRTGPINKYEVITAILICRDAFAITWAY